MQMSFETHLIELMGSWLNGRALALQARGSEIETLRFHVDVFYYSTWYTLSLVYRYTKPTKRFFRYISLNLITATFLGRRLDIGPTIHYASRNYDSISDLV